MGKKFYGLTGTRLNIAIAVIAGTDFALFGYDQGVLGGLLTLPSFLRYFPEIDVYSKPKAEQGTASNVQGITVGGYTLGCFFGAVATIWLGNFLGRKKTIFIGSLIMVVGAAIQASSFSLPQLIVARLITGFGNGFSFLEPSSIAWRFPIAFQILLALFVAIMIPGLPESPRWLILKGREQEALEVLAALSNLPEDDVTIQDEFHAIKDTVFEMARGGFSDCFVPNRNRNLHRTILAYVNQMMQQISGINIITYYAATIFENNIGLGSFTSRLLAALNGTEYFVASWVAIFIIEKVGRRKLMLFGAAGQALSMAVLAGTTSHVSKSSGIAAAVFLFVFNSFFAVGWLGMTWLVPAEITPLSIRAPANAIATTGNWIWNFMVVMVTPVAFAAIGYKTYIIFAVINAFMVPTVYFFYPETAYRSLEEMDEIFQEAQGLKGIFTVVKIAKHKPHRYGKNGELLIQYDELRLGDV
nr:hypothetical protein B0A51_06201 [Rachicladosporium sp. CCFEE 5018]